MTPDPHQYVVVLDQLDGGAAKFVGPYAPEPGAVVSVPRGHWETMERPGRLLVTVEPQVLTR